MKKIELRFFFFSSRRRHTRCGRDWSSDVCSSDLGRCGGTGARSPRRAGPRTRRRSEERRVGKSVDLGGRRIIKKKKEKRKRQRQQPYQIQPTTRLQQVRGKST